MNVVLQSMFNMPFLILPYNIESQISKIEKTVIEVTGYNDGHIYQMYSTEEPDT